MGPRRLAASRGRLALPCLVPMRPNLSGTIMQIVKLHQNLIGHTVSLSAAFASTRQRGAARGRRQRRQQHRVCRQRRQWRRPGAAALERRHASACLCRGALPALAPSHRPLLAVPSWFWQDFDGHAVTTVVHWPHDQLPSPPPPEPGCCLVMGSTTVSHALAQSLGMPCSCV